MNSAGLTPGNFENWVDIMPRTYIRKTEKANYPKEDLMLAVENVKNDYMTLAQASTAFNIPRQTIRDYVCGKTHKSSSLGRPTDLSPEEESKVVEGIKTMEKWGFGLSRKEVMDLVAEYVRQNKITTRFKDGYPGEDWFTSFRKRHNLSIKKPQNVEYARKKSLDPFIVFPFFQTLQQTIDKLDLSSKPERVWNLDETSFCTDPSKTKVVGQKNVQATRTTSGPGKENITVCLACNAAGGKAAPLIIFKGKNMWDQWVPSNEQVFPGTSFAATSNGWMETETFYNYFQTTFLSAVGTEKPALLIYDGHSTHLSIKLIECAIENEITILQLPAHSSHFLQPLDVSTFKPMKDKWDAALVAWQRQHIGERMSKKNFSIKISDVWKQISKQIIINGFKKAGSFPCNKDVISQNAFESTQLKRWIDFNHSPPQTLQNDLIIASTEPTENTSEIFSSASQNQELLPEVESPAIEALQTSGSSFEELFLERIGKTSTPQVKPKRKRVCVGGQVITTTDILNKLKEDAALSRKPKQKVKKAKKIKKAQVVESNGGEESQDESDKENERFLVGDFILAEFCGGQKNDKKFRYVCIIQEIKQNGEFQVVGLKSSAISKRIFTVVEKDVSLIERSSVVQKLKNPKLVQSSDLRFSYQFNDDVNCMEM